jgi:hypothetical protein
LINQWELVYCEEGFFEHHINGRKHKQIEGEMILKKEKTILEDKIRSLLNNSTDFSRSK